MAGTYTMFVFVQKNALGASQYIIYNINQLLEHKKFMYCDAPSRPPCLGRF